MASLNSDPRVVAFIEASRSGDAGRVSELLKEGANIEGVAIEGWTPLTRAADAGNLDVVRILVLHGADVDRGTGDIPSHGVTPLLLAAFNGHVDVVQFLAEHGAHLNLQPEQRAFFLSRVQSFKNPSLTELVNGLLPR
jgi:ankyrin repeat protein